MGIRNVVGHKTVRITELPAVSLSKNSEFTVEHTECFGIVVIKSGGFFEAMPIQWHCSD
jgi:hypothetical protein